jgi:single-stranded DNA-binding protein
MAENMKFTVYPCQSVIKGELTKIDMRMSGSGNRFAVASVLVVDSYNGKKEEQTFDVTVFKKQLEEFIDGKVKEGDDVEIVVRLKSELYKDRNYLKAIMSSLSRVGSNPERGDNVSRTVQQEAPSRIDDEQPLPF